MLCRVREGAAKGDPHANSYKCHDQNGDGRRNNAFAFLVVGVATSRVPSLDDGHGGPFVAVVDGQE
jgi:hypothetical protein